MWREGFEQHLDNLIDEYLSEEKRSEGTVAMLVCALNAYSHEVLEQVKQRYYDHPSTDRLAYGELLKSPLIQSHDKRVDRVYELLPDKQSLFEFFSTKPFYKLNEEQVFQKVVDNVMGEKKLRAFLKKYFD
ncbi:hypothetical protein GF367_00945 [Candidatus Woesearchaeota archaeon]|nr:hypothetical protein [Candidatus Woesearchaeota archaeon]